MAFGFLKKAARGLASGVKSTVHGVDKGLHAVANPYNYSRIGMSAGKVIGGAALAPTAAAFGLQRGIAHGVIGGTFGLLKQAFVPGSKAKSSGAGAPEGPYDLGPSGPAYLPPPGGPAGYGAGSPYSGGGYDDQAMMPPAQGYGGGGDPYASAPDAGGGYAPPAYDPADDAAAVELMSGGAPDEDAEGADLGDYAGTLADWKSDLKGGLKSFGAGAAKFGTNVAKEGVSRGLVALGEKLGIKPAATKSAGISAGKVAVIAAAVGVPAIYLLTRNRGGGAAPARRVRRA